MWLTAPVLDLCVPVEFLLCHSRICVAVAHLRVSSVMCVCVHKTAVGQLFNALLLRVQSYQRRIKKFCICIIFTSPIFFFFLPRPLAIYLQSSSPPPPSLAPPDMKWSRAPSLLNDESNNVSGFPWALLPLRNHWELAFTSRFFSRFKHSHRW